MKEGQKLSLCMFIGNSYSLPRTFPNKVLSQYSQIIGLLFGNRSVSENLFFLYQTFWQVISGNCGEKMPTINIFGYFLSKRSLKSFSDKILLDNNMNHPLEKTFSNNFYNRRRITLVSFLDYPCWTSFHFLDIDLSIWKLQTPTIQNMYIT